MLALLSEGLIGVIFLATMGITAWTAMTEDRSLMKWVGGVMALLAVGCLVAAIMLFQKPGQGAAVCGLIFFGMCAFLLFGCRN